MKQIASTYTYNKTTGVIVLSGLTIDRDQLLLIVNTTRNVTYYNFADSTTTLQSYVNPSVYKGFYDGGALYNIGDIVQTNGNPYGTAGGFFIRLQAANAGYAPAEGGGSNSHWAPTSASGTTITLNASVVSSASNHNNADALTIYYDDQTSSNIAKLVVDVDGWGQNIGVGTVVAGSENGVVRVLPYSLNADLEGGPISTANPMPIIGTDLSALNVRLYKGGDPVDGDNALDVTGTVTASVVGRDANSTATPQIPVINYEEGIAAANDGWVVPVQVTNVGGQISEVNPLPISGTVTASDSGWVLLGTRDWNAVGTPWDITGLNQYSSIRLENNGGGGSEIEAFAYGNYQNDMCWAWDGDTRAAFNRTLGFADGKPYTAPVQYDGIRFVLMFDNSNDPCISKLYGKKNFTNLGLTNFDLRSTPVAISGTVTAYPAQGTTASRSNFSSINADSSLVSAVAGRKVLTVFNEGAGILYISAGSTCSTASYQVRLSAGDYWECPEGQASLAHSAVFATAGTARVTQVS